MVINSLKENGSTRILAKEESSKSMVDTGIHVHQMAKALAKAKPNIQQLVDWDTFLKG